MKVRFYVEKRKGEDGRLIKIGRPIFMTVSFNGNRVIISTGLKVDLEAWDRSTQRVKEYNPDAYIINSWLSSLEHTAGATWKALASLSEKPGAREFRRTFERLRPCVSGRFFDVLLVFMEEGAAKWSSSNYKKVRTFYRQLQEFEEKTGYKMAFNTINTVFLEKYVNHYISEDLAPSTIWKSVNVLVTFLNWATEKGYNVFYEYKSFYKKLNYKREAQGENPVFLYWDEIVKMQDYDCKSTREERARDLFLIMCYTGIRFNELQRVEKGAVSKNVIQMRTIKGNIRELSLNDHAVKIVTKYIDRYYPDNKAFPRMSIVTMNKYLKKICGNLLLNRQVLLKKSEGAQYGKLSEHISAGVAVNTFIYHALRLDVSPETIGFFTGVKKDKRIELIRTQLAKKEINRLC